MEVILLEKVQNLGDLGDVVDVRSGYGRNFLIPQGKAVRATATNKAEFEARREELERRANEQLVGAEKREADLKDVSVSIEANASTEGKLYGSVAPRDIANALTAAGHPVEKAEVIMGEGPIREAGEFQVPIQLHADITVDVTVIVVPVEQ